MTEPTQLALFGAPSPPCVFGEIGEGWSGPHHCAHCAAAITQGCTAFTREVAAGRFNARGYTRREWTQAGHSAATWRKR